MNKEIEIKLTYKDKTLILKRLKEIGARFREKYGLEDVYFSMDSDNMSNKNNLIRLRKRGDKSELTFKGDHESKDNIWKRTELNTGVSDFDSAVRIFEKLNFNKVSETNSFREFWDVGDVEFAFIDLTHPAEVKFIEIEGASEEKVKDVLSMFEGLVVEAGEEIFRGLDEARKGKGLIRKNL